MKKLYYCFCFILLAFISCNHYSTKTAKIFDRIENIVDQFPDSALMLLDSIRNPYELSKSEYAKYILFSVQTKNKAYKNIEMDTLIFFVRDYFKEKNDRKNWVLSELYSGRVLLFQGKKDEAMKSYLEVKNIASKEDLYVVGLSETSMGALYYNQSLLDEAIPHFKNAIAIFSGFDDKYKSQIASLSDLGNAFLLKEDYDSAFYYYNKGLEIAQLHNDSVKQAVVLHNISVAYRWSGEFERAKATLKQIRLLNPDYNKREDYSNMANIYLLENKKDSALYYANLSLALSEDNDYQGKSAAYDLLSDIEEASGNYRESLNYHRQHSDYREAVFKESQGVAILDIQKKYDFELIQNANKKLVIERLWIFIILSVVALVVVIVAFIFHRKHMQNKEALLMAKQQIYQLKEMANLPVDNKNNEKENELRKILFEQLDIFKKISLLEAYLVDKDKEKGKEILTKVNEIMYNSSQRFDWKIFYQPVNTLYDNFLIRLKDLYPDLNEEDMLVCCLSKAGFSNTEIALLMQSNPNIVQKKKSAIREKTGMTRQENFVKQLEEIVK